MLLASIGISERAQRIFQKSLYDELNPGCHNVRMENLEYDVAQSVAAHPLEDWAKEWRLTDSVYVAGK